MNIEFPKKPLKDIMDAIQNAMNGRALADMVSLKTEGENLVVTISKLGTSTLTFAKKEANDKVMLNLANEKIAFAHKAFKDEVKEKLCSVVEKAGGKVLP